MRPWSTERFRRASPLDGLAVVAVALVVLVVFLDEPRLLPRTSEARNLSPLMLPLYAACSLLRMLAAYAFSLGFALGAGYWASAWPLGRRLILPALDVMQAVPILGFFPAAIFFFIRLFHGSPLGVEAAAIFLIFTSQACEAMAETPGPDDLYRLAHRLRLPLDGLHPLVQAARLLGWARVAHGDHDLTSEGRRVAAATVAERKAFFRERVRDLPLIASILRALEAGAPVSREAIRVGLFPPVAEPEAERQVDTAVDRGRWAELFDYDADDACFLRTPPTRGHTDEA